MALTNNMFAARIAGDMIRAKALLADRTGRATGRTEPLLAFGARLNGQGPAMAAWTFDQTVVTIGCFVNRLIKARADDTLAGGTTDQTILTEALSTGATAAHFGAILVTARTAQRTITTNIDGFARGDFHLINAQMAAALAHATVAACLLTGMADFIATDGTLAAMFGAGALTTGPTEAPTSVTVGFATNWTSCNATCGTQNLLATLALRHAGVTNQMAAAV